MRPTLRNTVGDFAVERDVTGQPCLLQWSLPRGVLTENSSKSRCVARVHGPPVVNLPLAVCASSGVSNIVHPLLRSTGLSEHANASELPWELPQH